MFRLDKLRAITLAFSWPSGLFVFIFIYPEKLCSVLLFSNVLHTGWVTDIKTQELPSRTAARCQSAAPSKQPAVKHLAQGRLNWSCWRSRKACLIHFPVQNLFAPNGHEFAFLNFCPGRRCSTNFQAAILQTCPMLPITLMTGFPKRVVWIFQHVSITQTAEARICMQENFSHFKYKSKFAWKKSIGYAQSAAKLTHLSSIDRGVSKCISKPIPLRKHASVLFVFCLTFVVELL